MIKTRVESPPLKYFNEEDVKNFKKYFLHDKEKDLLNQIAKDIYPIRISLSQVDKTYKDGVLTIPGIMGYQSPIQDGNITYAIHELAHCIEAEDSKLFHEDGFNFYYGPEYYMPGKIIRIPQNNKGIRRELRVFAIATRLMEYYSVFSDIQEDVDRLMDFMSDHLIGIPIKIDDYENISEFRKAQSSFFTQCIVNTYNTKYSEAFVFNRLEEIKQTLLTKGENQCTSD